MHTPIPLFSSLIQEVKGIAHFTCIGCMASFTDSIYEGYYEYELHYSCFSLDQIGWIVRHSFVMHRAEVANFGHTVKGRDYCLIITATNQWTPLVLDESIAQSSYEGQILKLRVKYNFLWPPFLSLVDWRCNCMQLVFEIQLITFLQCVDSS